MSISYFLKFNDVTIDSSLTVAEWSEFWRPTRLLSPNPKFSPLTDFYYDSMYSTMIVHLKDVKSSKDEERKFYSSLRYIYQNPYSVLDSDKKSKIIWTSMDLIIEEKDYNKKFQELNKRNADHIQGQTIPDGELINSARKYFFFFNFLWKLRNNAKTFFITFSEITRESFETLKALILPSLGENESSNVYDSYFDDNYKTIVFMLNRERNKSTKDEFFQILEAYEIEYEISVHNLDAFSKIEKTIFPNPEKMLHQTINPHKKIFEDSFDYADLSLLSKAKLPKSIPKKSFDPLFRVTTITDEKTIVKENKNFQTLINFQTREGGNNNCFANVGILAMKYFTNDTLLQHLDAYPETIFDNKQKNLFADFKKLLLENDSCDYLDNFKKKYLKNVFREGYQDDAQSFINKIDGMTAYNKSYSIPMIKQIFDKSNNVSYEITYKENFPVSFFISENTNKKLTDIISNSLEQTITDGFPDLSSTDIPFIIFEKSSSDVFFPFQSSFQFSNNRKQTNDWICIGFTKYQGSGAYGHWTLLFRNPNGWYRYNEGRISLVDDIEGEWNSGIRYYFIPRNFKQEKFIENSLNNDLKKELQKQSKKINIIVKKESPIVPSKFRKTSDILSEPEKKKQTKSTSKIPIPKNNQFVRIPINFYDDIGSFQENLPYFVLNENDSIRSISYEEFSNQWNEQKYTNVGMFIFLQDTNLIGTFGQKIKNKRNSFKRIGGKREQKDRNWTDTLKREWKEEVGIDFPKNIFRITNASNSLKVLLYTPLKSVLFIVQSTNFGDPIISSLQTREKRNIDDIEIDVNYSSVMNKENVEQKLLNGYEFLNVELLKEYFWTGEIRNPFEDKNWHFMTDFENSEENDLFVYTLVKALSI